MHDPALGVHPSAGGVRHEAQIQDGVGPSPGVDRDEDEAGQVTCPVLRVAPRGPQQRRHLVPCQPTVARRRHRRQLHARSSGQMVLGMAIVDRCLKRAQFFADGRRGAIPRFPVAPADCRRGADREAATARRWRARCARDPERWERARSRTGPKCQLPSPDRVYAVPWSVALSDVPRERCFSLSAVSDVYTFSASRRPNTEGCSYLDGVEIAVGAALRLPEKGQITAHRDEFEVVDLRTVMLQGWFRLQENNGCGVLP